TLGGVFIQLLEPVAQLLRVGEQRHLGSAQHHARRSQPDVAVALPQEIAHHSSLAAPGAGAPDSGEVVLAAASDCARAINDCASTLAIGAGAVGAIAAMTTLRNAPGVNEASRMAAPAICSCGATSSA